MERMERREVFFGFCCNVLGKVFGNDRCGFGNSDSLFRVQDNLRFCFTRYTAQTGSFLWMFWRTTGGIF
jgi:hypothetical protein